jgi:hypothetical protein
MKRKEAPHNAARMTSWKTFLIFMRGAARTVESRRATHGITAHVADVSRRNETARFGRAHEGKRADEAEHARQPQQNRSRGAAAACTAGSASARSEPGRHDVQPNESVAKSGQNFRCPLSVACRGASGRSDGNQCGIIPGTTFC